MTTKSTTPQKQKSLLSFFGAKATNTSDAPSSSPKDTLSSIHVSWRDESVNADDHLPCLSSDFSKKKEMIKVTPITDKIEKALRVKSNDSPFYSSNPTLQSAFQEKIASISENYKKRTTPSQSNPDECEDAIATPTKARKSANIIMDSDEDKENIHCLNSVCLASGKKTTTGVSCKNPMSPVTSSVLTTRSNISNFINTKCDSRYENFYEMDKEEPLSSIDSKTGLEIKDDAIYSMDRDELDNLEDSEEETMSLLKGVKKEERYPWLVNIKDSEGHASSDPDYNPRTLYIPNTQWKQFTPFEKQFWEIKSAHFDTVVFFKKGKFYELYENDAEIGSRLFDLKMTDRINMKMVGVPEGSWEFWANKFILAGYKVAKVDQMETAVGKSMREKASKSPKEEKIIKRELTAVLTAGTLTDPALISTDMATYCISIKEVFNLSKNTFSFGIAFVDTATAEFSLSFIKNDDAQYTLIKTLLMQLRPKELIVEKSTMQSKTIKMIHELLPTSTMSQFTTEKEFWSARKTCDEIDRAGYFSASLETASDSQLKTGWPTPLLQFKENSLVMSALGALVYYLRSLKLDYNLLGFKNFILYEPLRTSDVLLLDGQTLHNLDILYNSSLQSNNDSGTLFKFINYCLTPFGKRLLKRWICCPLKNKVKIEERLDAVDFIYKDNHVVESIKTTFPKLPDLERLLSRIHSGSCKLKEFLAILDSFKMILAFFKSLADKKIELKSSVFISRMVMEFPTNEMTEVLNFFDQAFDKKKALEEGFVIPNLATDSEYDAIIKSYNDVEELLEDYLQELKQKYRRVDIKYKDINNTLYQIEMPTDTQVPSDWQLMSKTKNCVRYWTPIIKENVKALEELKETKKNYLNSLLNKYLKHFNSYRFVWFKMIYMLAEIDCIYSLQQYRRNLGVKGSRPQFVDVSAEQDSLFCVKNSYHPCLIHSSSIDFIPNDVYLGSLGHPNMMILTGPNMGGKSTLLRQICMLVILAQLGCYVPAEECKMSLFDRIFTRIGAHDNILTGESTFMVELDETSKLLKLATNRSLVILDELGRGTSTYDGYAIAYSTLYYLTNYIGCLGLFSTHYRQLTREFVGVEKVGAFHMNCMVDEEKKLVVFLYKLERGTAPKSYGMNVAAMAGIPTTIIEKAKIAADEFENSSHQLDIKKSLVSIFQLADMYTLLSFTRGNQNEISSEVVDRIFQNYRRS